MQFTRAFAFLVCASYTLATTCAACADEIHGVPLSGKCYETEFAYSGGRTVCAYVSRDDAWDKVIDDPNGRYETDGVPTGATCTYNVRLG
jgi:hypothetical protein